MVTLKLTQGDRQTSALRVKRSLLAIALLLTQVASDSPVAIDVNNNNNRNRRARLLLKGPNEVFPSHNDWLIWKVCSNANSLLPKTRRTGVVKSVEWMLELMR